MGGFEVVEVGFCLCEVGLQFTILCSVISFVQLINHMFLLFWFRYFASSTPPSCHVVFSHFLSFVKLFADTFCCVPSGSEPPWCTSLLSCPLPKYLQFIKEE